MQTIKALILATTIVAASCGDTKNHSKIKDIATPGNIEANNQLIWFQDGVIYKARCTLGELPIRENCTTETQTAAYEALLERVNSIIKSEINYLESQKSSLLSVLLENHPTIVHLKEKISSLELSITTKKSDIVNLAKNIDATLSTIQILAEQISDYNQQILAVNNRLSSNPSDATLLRLKETLLQEQRVLIGKKDTEENKVISFQHDRSLATTDLSSLERSLADEKELLNLRLRTLNVENDETRAIDADIFSKQSLLNRVSGVFQKITDRAISYRSNQLTDGERGVLGKILEAFTDSIRFSNGYVEVRINGRWGGICDDSFDQRDGEVLCRMVGQTFVSFRSTQGPDNFLIDDLDCRGTETNVFQCSRSNSEDCSGNENVYLQCR